MNLTSKLPHVGTTIFAIMSGLARECKAINLSQGFPGFPLDETLVELVAEAMREGHNQYAPMPGLPALRQAIAQKYNTSYGLALDEENVTVTSGATEALFAAIAAFVRPGDEVIVLEPAYDSYIPAIELSGGVPVRVPLQPQTYLPDWERVEAAVTPKTRAILTNSPHNPTGAVFTAEDLAQLERLAEKHDLLVLSDEVYEHIIFDGKAHQSALRSEALRQRTVAVFSFGKTFHATGWKVGYAIAPKALTAEFRKVHQFLTFSTHTPTQVALANYLKVPERYTTLPNFYQGKRDAFLRVMQKTPFQLLPAGGTYFQLAHYGHLTQESDQDFARRLTREFGVASIPVSSFYHDGQDDKVLRFCFAKEEAELEAAAARLQHVTF